MINFSKQFTVPCNIYSRNPLHNILELFANIYNIRSLNGVKPNTFKCRKASQTISDNGDAENAEHENARHENVAPNDAK